MNRTHLSPLKPFLYGPLDTLSWWRLRCNGGLKRMQAEYHACASDEDHWNFACRYFKPCQIKSEILDFIAWLRPQNPRRIIEIGFARGGTNYLFRKLLPGLEEMISIDLHPRHPQLHRRVSPPGLTLTLISGRSESPGTLRRIEQTLAGKCVDLLFIDGNHAYDAVMQDYALYSGFVKPGGVIALHDIVPANPGDHTFEVGVHRAWATISDKKQAATQTFIENPEQNSFGIGAIIEVKTEF